MMRHRFECYSIDPDFGSKKPRATVLIGRGITTAWPGDVMHLVKHEPDIQMSDVKRNGLPVAALSRASACPEVGLGVCTYVRFMMYCGGCRLAGVLPKGWCRYVQYRGPKIRRRLNSTPFQLTVCTVTSEWWTTVLGVALTTHSCMLMCTVQKSLALRKSNLSNGVKA